MPSGRRVPKTHHSFEDYIFSNDRKSQSRDDHKYAAISFLLKNAKPHTFKARHVIARQSDEIDQYYIIKEGIIRLAKNLSDGRRQVLGFSLPGDLIGQHFRQLWPFDIEAVTPVTVYQLTKKTIDTMIAEHPKISLSLYKTTQDELSLYQDHILRLNSATAEEKICRFLIDLKFRWQAIRADDPLFIPMPMARQDVADYVGLTFETVSRILNRLQKENVIALVSNGIEILNSSYFEKFF